MNAVEPGLLQKLDEACSFIVERLTATPDIAIILGTGLGHLTQRIQEPVTVSYSEIPHFPEVTVESHAGRLVAGILAGKKVIAMEGRFHFYEGYTLEQVTFPVRVMARLGARKLIVTNAAGGLDLTYRKGEIVIIEDHINFMGVNPLIGPNDERIGPRFPDMSEPYSAKLAGIAEEAAREAGVPVRRGVYLGLTGPCLETKSEYRMIRQMGADLVGMSTVPEVIAGVHMGLEILGISVVTDICDPDHLQKVEIKEIIRIANEAGPKLDKLVTAIIAGMP